jgi:uncharacterized protein YndB with AHSA1/START domain
MSPIRVQNDTIVQEVRIKAPAERIFAALTEPGELLKWWTAPGKFKIVHAECDLQPGGKWLMRVMSDSGGEGRCSMVSGEYRSIESPRLLTYTWIRESENYPETLVRWDLDEKEGFTTVRVTHSGLITEELRQRNNGWPLIAMLLKAHIDKLQ